MIVPVLVEGQSVDVAAGATCGEVLKEALSNKRFKKVLACRCGDSALDLSRPFPEGCSELAPIYSDTEDGLDVIRHSAAHIMAEAVKSLYPDAKVTIGPAVANGFYYDFDYERPFTPEDLEAIEAEMRRIVGQDHAFACELLPKVEAVKVFEEMGESYKPEIMDDLGGDEFSVYSQGKFTDLCRGPHIPSTGKLAAFKLLSVAGAYWRGDEKNKMLQRIYGTAFASPKELDKYLRQLEEAKKRDHRKIGTQLDLFSFSEHAAGMCIWHPKGMLVRTILEDFERKEHLRRGYDIVRGPQLLRRELWEHSGHLANYGENMYFTEIDEQVYGIKPMNCLSHMLIYKAGVRSYRDLPIRYFELGTVHRHEKSGVLHGLTRVRQFTQDDAHVLCRPDQLQDEIIAILNFVRDVMTLFGFEYEMELSTRPEKSIGSDEDWERATTALEAALKSLDIP
jgi:threonyl-tRNA synthetase